MNDEEERTFVLLADAQLAAAAAATLRGHELADWHRISGRVFANMCLQCGALAFVERPAGVPEGLWYVEGTALDEPCPGAPE